MALNDSHYFKVQKRPFFFSVFDCLLLKNTFLFGVDLVHEKKALSYFYYKASYCVLTKLYKAKRIYVVSQ